MSQTKSHLPFIYNPGEFSKSELIENYVIRKQEFEQIFDTIKNDNMQNPPQHIIIQGQRGTGKTTLLLRLSYAIEDDHELNKWLIPIVSDEESWGISTLAEFWKHTAEDLEDIDDDFYGISDEMEKNEEDTNFEGKCFEIVQNWLSLHKKKVILFIDNFGDLIKKFSRQEHQRFREILLTCSDLRIVAASSVVLEFTYEYSEPFFEFFKVFNLQSIKKKEAESLLLKLGESYKSKEVKKIIENSPQRVEAIRRITNGVPRTIVLLYEIFIDNVNGNAFRDLEFTLDKITPLYKHRMDDLKPISQKIVNILALNWDAMPVKDISLQTKIISKQVSAQLSYLEKSGIVTKQRTNTKNHLYYLSERFFNIWYLMRRGRKKHKNKVRFLVEFLELWCTPGQLLDVVSNLKDAMHRGTVYEKHALLYEREYKDYKKVEEYYLKAIEKGDSGAMNNYAWILFERKERREEALNYARQAVSVDKIYNSSHTLLIILLWNEEIEEAVKLWNYELFNEESLEEWKKGISDILNFFIAKKQYSFIYNIFKENKFEIKDQYKPIYFALLYFMGSEYEMERKKMGPEFKETVDEIIDTIIKLQEDY